MNPPPVHEYWNYHNALILIAIIPIYYIVGYVSNYLGSSIVGYNGMNDFADSEDSPMKVIKFGDPQQ